MGSIGGNATTNSKYNSKGELKNGETIIYTSSRGIKYHVHNVGGVYEVFVRKTIGKSTGGYKEVDEFRPVTNEIRRNVKLEKG